MAPLFSEDVLKTLGTDRASCSRRGLRRALRGPTAPLRAGSVPVVRLPGAAVVRDLPRQACGSQRALRPLGSQSPAAPCVPAAVAGAAASAPTSGARTPPPWVDVLRVVEAGLSPVCLWFLGL